MEHLFAISTFSRRSISFFLGLQFTFFFLLLSLQNVYHAIIYCAERVSISHYLLMNEKSREKEKWIHWDHVHERANNFIMCFGWTGKKKRRMFNLHLNGSIHVSYTKEKNYCKEIQFVTTLSLSQINISSKQCKCWFIAFYCLSSQQDITQNTTFFFFIKLLLNDCLANTMILFNRRFFRLFFSLHGNEVSS